MPVRGESRYIMAEPFYFFDVVGELNVNGVYEEVVLVDREKSLERIRPYLMMI